MKAIVTVNSRGMVTLPAKLRRAAGIKADDRMIVETTPDGLLLRLAVILPIETYTKARLKEFAKTEAVLEKVLARQRTRRC
jgi:AbrB family looped-hinge helix DNA binding protein